MGELGITVLRVCQKWSKEVDAAELGLEGLPEEGPTAAKKGERRKKDGRPRKVAKPKKK